MTATELRARLREARDPGDAAPTDAWELIEVMLTSEVLGRPEPAIRGGAGYVSYAAGSSKDREPIN